MTRARSSYAAAVLAVCFLGASVALAGSEPAFPGAEGPVLSNAEGFGAATVGGKGGKVIWVTNLSSAGPGSLRAAIDTQGPRIIKFKVAGTIEVGRKALWVGFPYRPTWKKLLKEGKTQGQMRNPYSFLTIDGVSAPPPGITISGNLFLGPYALEQVIVRNLRVRDSGLVARASAHCICALARNVLVDHCSLQWARDQVFGARTGTTFQWCIVGPAWGTHALGFLCGYDRVGVHHCLFANNAGRNPRISGSERKIYNELPNPTPVIDFRNNVIYNWWNVGSAWLVKGVRANMVGNLYLPGRTSRKGRSVIMSWPYPNVPPTEAYLKGNISASRRTDDMDEWACAGHYAKVEGRAVYKPGPSEYFRRRKTPWPAPPVVTHSAQEAKALVLSQAGAWPRDPVDAGVVRTVLDNSGFVGVKHTRPADFTNARPTVRASAAKSPGPLTVEFRGEGRDPDGKIVIHAWNFGDGQRAVGPVVNHAYASPGEYVATFFVVDNVGMSATSSLKISIGGDRFKAEPVKAPAPVKPARTPRQPWKPPTVNLGARLAGPPAETDWTSATRLAPFIDQATWKKERRGMFDARLLHDARNLYIRVLSDGIGPAWIKRLKPFEVFTSPRRHSLEYVAGMKFQFFLSPRHGQDPFYCFVVEPRGQRYDARGPDCTWNPSPDWRIKSKAVDGKWQLTAAIPFKALAMTPEKGRLMGLKIIANTAKNAIHIWPPVGSAGKDRYCVPHTSDPIYYAKLQFP